MPATPRLYLDWNATAPLSPQARAAVVDALSLGNASAVHAEGRAARVTIETVRRALGARFGVPADRVTFTSGGTEANNMALSPGVAGEGRAPAERLIVSAVEHAAVRAGGRFGEAAVCPVDGHGVIDLGALEDLLAADPRPALVAVMAANNETGVVQPLSDVAALAARFGATVHTDAVQAFGRLSDGALMADTVALSGHKLGAPFGVGALVKRTATHVPPLLTGGGQERGARGGTENVTAIAGFGASLAGPAANADAWAETRVAREAFERDLLAHFPDAVVFGAGAERLPNTVLFSVGAVPAELALIALDMAGAALSSGAACSSGTVQPSHVLAAMGVPDARSRTALRASVGPSGAAADLDRFLLALQEAVVPMGVKTIS
ncbi:MAG: cysteine desulfurase family protein [Pseudomonadota bacterium]